jgi:hypothetical protein
MLRAYRVGEVEARKLVHLGSVEVQCLEDLQTRGCVGTILHSHAHMGPVHDTAWLA